eukprot:15361993-Ditylum_brightwellii.AAC.1
MEITYQSKVIPAGWLLMMNFCHVYLQVQTVALISSSNGKHMLQRYLDRLINPLGVWKQPQIHLPQYHQQESAIYIKQTDRLSKLTINTRTRSKLIAHEEEEANKSTMIGKPLTDLIQMGQRWTATIPMEVMLPRKVKHSTATFKEYIGILPAWERQLLRNFKTTGKGLNIKTAIVMDKNIWIVINRGLNVDDSYFGWVIAMDAMIIWKRCGYVQGEAKQMESLRTENVGTL